MRGAKGTFFTNMLLYIDTRILNFSKIYSNIVKMMTQLETYEKRQAEHISYLSSLLKSWGKRDLERWSRATYNFRVQVDFQLKLKGWTQEDLAMFAGIATSRLSQILALNPRTSKRPNITIKTMNRIASALDCSLDVRLTTFTGQCSTPKFPIAEFTKEFSLEGIAARKDIFELMAQRIDWDSPG